MNKDAPFLCIVLLAWFALLVSCGGNDQSQALNGEAATVAKQLDASAREIARQEPFVARAINFQGQDRWQGNGISYGPYREGQRPGGDEPTKEQIREDLHLLAGDDWQMIRIYGTEPFAKTVCEVIREDKLPIRVMVGAWIATEQENPQQQAFNRSQIERAIEIANEFENIVFAVSVGNESQVSWSFHKVNPQRLVQYVREIRSKVAVPVTVADDFMYWITDESKSMADEIDLIVTHVYAMWHGKTLDNAVEFTKEKFELVKKQHPSKPIVLGEGGWATEKAASGDEAQRIKGVAGEAQQKEFFEAYTRWLRSERIPYFYFEAFDEPWKGGPDLAGAEKHWGLFRVDRTRKPAIADLGGVSLRNVEVEAACGQCQFGMTGKDGCDLAIRMDGKTYFVEGTGIDDHGDAHAGTGFCNCIRKAKVTGCVRNGVLVTTELKLQEVASSSGASDVK